MWLLEVESGGGEYDQELEEYDKNVETKENSQRRTDNNNKAVIKHSQEPLVPSQGL